MLEIFMMIPGLGGVVMQTVLAAIYDEGTVVAGDSC